MRILFIGDVVGRCGREAVAASLPKLREALRIDLAVVNAENASHGFGLAPDMAAALFAAGADVITGGNHAFEGAEVEAVLGHERMLRPLNVAEATPGRGALTTSAAGEDVRVVVLADEAALDFAPPFARMTLEPYAAYASLPPGPTTIIEMHALSVTAKQGLAYALDGEVAAVLGTHTHEPTLPLWLLPAGTALVTDVGMTGPRDGPQGMDPQGVIDRVRGLPDGELSPMRTAGGEIILGAVLLEIEHGITLSLSRVS